MRLCKEDCEELESNVCGSDFKVARQFDYLAVILPNCTALPPKGSTEAEGCTKLGILGTVYMILLPNCLVFPCETEKEFDITSSHFGPYSAHPLIVVRCFTSP